MKWPNPLPASPFQRGRGRIHQYYLIHHVAFLQLWDDNYILHYELPVAKMRFSMEKVVKGRIGGRVEESGSYVCDNCGHYQFFDKGEEFEDCQTCNEADITWELE